MLKLKNYESIIASYNRTSKNSDKTSPALSSQRMTVRQSVIKNRRKAKFLKNEEVDGLDYKIDLTKNQRLFDSSDDEDP